METLKYKELLAKHTFIHHGVKKKAANISFARLVVGLSILFVIYLFLRNQNFYLLLIAGILVTLFIFLVRFYANISAQKKFAKASMDINQNELDFLEKGLLSFADGLEFVDTDHAYSFDLDFFGQKSLYQVLNRTETYIGSQMLANTLLHRQKSAIILAHQEAIQELANETEWRQDIQALGRLTKDSKSVYDNLQQWTRTEKTEISNVLKIMSFVLPIFLIGMTVYNFTFDAGIGNYCVLLFLINLGILSRQLKSIKKELINSTKIDRTIKNYSLILKKIETKNFSSSALIQLQQNLKTNGKTASEEIRKLSQLFDQLESILNPFGAILFNGFLLFHLHTLRGFRKWKREHADKIGSWLRVMGQIETFNSLATFTQNNPDFTFPTLNNTQQIEFEDLGHPLLNAKNRVTSSVRFSKQNFIILTGSNMSGKSTFLRSLGVNMVLAGMGAPLCAKSATIQPMPVYVSMRVSDSLNDNESFFFAEVKRLKKIMVAADKEVSFVLLDEILRGTNSDDKRTGTVEVLKKIISKNAIGALATHDLKVCDTAAEFPNQLVNKCFEVEIVNDELFFDYKLREGVCKNKSATFLMKKMNII